MSPGLHVAVDELGSSTERNRPSVGGEREQHAAAKITGMTACHVHERKGHVR